MVTFTLGARNLDQLGSLKASDVEDDEYLDTLASGDDFADDDDEDEADFDDDEDDDFDDEDDDDDFDDEDEDDFEDEEEDFDDDPLDCL